MVRETKSESIEQRHGQHINDVQEFLASRGLETGKPAAVSAFAARVAGPSPFAEEMESIVRSIVYQEDERLGRGELLELLVVAVGGPGIDGETPGLQADVRRIFVFLNGALRQQRMSFQPEADLDPAIAGGPTSRAEAETLPLTASDVLSSSSVRPDPARHPTEAVLHTPSPLHAEQDRPPVPRQIRPMPDHDVLFRALNLASQQELESPSELREQVPFDDRPARPALVAVHVVQPVVPVRVAEFTTPTAEEPAPPRSRTAWLVPVVAGSLAVIGVGAYLVRPAVKSPHGAPVVAPVADVSHASCAAPTPASTSRPGLEERSRWAHQLLDQKLFDAALPELREIARLDPGYPGIRLDESDALLNLKRPEEARVAVDQQIDFSECLSELPPQTLQMYCSTRYPDATTAGCQAQLVHIRQQAELQAALVHLDLGHSDEEGTGASAALSELTQESSALTQKPPARKPALPVPKLSKAAPLPPATEDDADRPALPKASAVRPVGKKPGAADPLVQGAGTDSAYGAYQKPD